MNNDWTSQSFRLKTCSISFLPANSEMEKEWFKWAITDLDLWFLLSGVGELTGADGTRHRIDPQTMILLRPGVVHRFRSFGQPTSMFYLHFEPVDPYGNALDTREWEDWPLLSHPLAPHSVETVLRRILLLLNGYRGLGNDQHTQIEAEAGCLLQAALHAFQTGATAKNLPPDALFMAADQQSENGRRIAAAHSWLEAHPELPITPPELAQKFGFSAKHFSKLFKARYQVTPARAIILRRIRYAQRMLENRRLTVSAIANLLHYEDVAYFSKQFKSVLGCSPNAYRNGSKRGHVDMFAFPKNGPGKKQISSY